MKITKLDAGFELWLEQGSIYFNEAGYALDTGLIELEKNNNRVFIVSDEFGVQFEKAFIAAGGVIE